MIDAHAHQVPPDLRPRTTGVIGARELGLMKRTAFLVNTSRGPIVEERCSTGMPSTTCGRA